MKRFQVEMGNNSDARRADILKGVSGAKVRHNGGKFVVVEVSDADAERTEILLKIDRRVSNYWDD